MSSAKFGVYRPRWAMLYEAAVSEMDDAQRLHLIAYAKGAIFQRQQELARAELEALEEQKALEDATYVLAALRKAAEFNLHLPQRQEVKLKTGTQ